MHSRTLPQTTAKGDPRILFRYALPLYAWVLFQAAYAGADGRWPIDSRNDLQYGAVLFEYNQGNYFNGLVEQACAAARDNPRALEHRGQLLKGSMALSYNLPDVAQPIFDRLLADEPRSEIRNRAWYFLAKLYHSRSNPEDAFTALENIRGPVPEDLLLDYHYLTTLLSSNPANLTRVEQAVDRLPPVAHQYPYLLFNLGISHLARGNRSAATRNLSAVLQNGSASEESRVLSDRARHGLAQIAIQEQELAEAWSHLQEIRTEGLYSNRALLAYAWTAIRQELFQTALPALHLLDSRSIALPEVQEGKVLLGHVYEQQGLRTRALESFLKAESDLLDGFSQLGEARRIADRGDLPRELVTFVDAGADSSGWTAVPSTAEYTRLAPFLVDLMASNAFRQVQGDLSELYVIRDNLAHWERQMKQHDLILKNADGKVFDEKMQKLVDESSQLHHRLQAQHEELELLTLTLEARDQSRFDALFDNARRQLRILDDKVANLKRRSEPYRQPPSYRKMVTRQHGRISERLREAEDFIARLEPAMRNLVKAELKRHEERMRYYLAQARLAKARLYDAALSHRNESGQSPAGNGGTGQ